MQSRRGFTLIETMVAVALFAILVAVAVPVLGGSTARNSVWTASEQIGAQVRQARLKAISRNTPFRLRFDCPSPGQFRVLVVTGNALIDNHADRCAMSQDLDSGIFAMPASVSYGEGVPTLEVNGRGMYSAAGAGLPLTITVSHGAASPRSLTVSATGQITFATY